MTAFSEFPTFVLIICVSILFPLSWTLHLNSNESVLTHIATLVNENATTGNTILYKEIENSDPDTWHSDQEIEENEIPVHYEGAQLWRIYNISNSRKSSSQLAEALESHFGGNIWKENSEFLDMSFEINHLQKARSFLQGLNISAEILNDNIQTLLDQEHGKDFNSARTKKASGARHMNWDEYHDIDVIYDFMKEIRNAHPDLVRIYTIGKTAKGRELKVLRISENPKKNPKVWIDGGIHAREWISPAVVTYIIENLMSNWSTLPKYLRSKTWYVMPVMNPDGYMYSRKTNRLWRKNRSKNSRYRCYGVDLNRNFDINWKGPGSSEQPCSDTYRGTSPGSELETQAVVQFLSRRKSNLGAYLTFHSYGQMVVYPWAYKKARVRDYKDLQAAASMAVNNIFKETGRSYRAAPTYQLLGVAGGGSDDWSRDTLGAKYVFTVELRDQGYYGFVLPKAQIKATGREGWTVVDTIARFF